MLRGILAGSAALLLLGTACSSPTTLDEVRVLGTLATAEYGYEGPNPVLMPLSDGRVRVEALIVGWCRLVRPDTEVEQWDRRAAVFVFEIREACPDRAATGSPHQVVLEFPPGGWAIVDLVGRDPDGGVLVLTDSVRVD